jgi:peptidoglycan/xylan/chitin deacetylase (PgdA/CDA1 family)
MASTVHRARGRRRPAASDAFRRAKRRRFLVRRLSFVLVLFFVVAVFSFGVALSGVSFSEKGYARAVLPVEATILPAPPRPQPPDMADMGRVWAAAVAKDPSPDLAARSKTGTSGGRVALTFDDGPDPRTTPLILDSLRRQDIKATFFVVGRQVKENPGLLRRIVAEGHTIGNHTYDHADLSGLNPKQTRLELRSTQKAVDDALGYHYPMVLMRPPYGDPYFGGSDALPVFQKIAREKRLFPVLWTLDPSDYLFGGRPEGVVKSVVRADKAAHKGKKDQVLLLHDTHRQSAEALPKIIDYFEESGRQFTGVDELVTDKYTEP